LFNRVASGEGIAAKLASIAQHVPTMRWIIVLELITFVDAVALAVALYGLTRDEDQELAVLALSCRVGEGILNAIPVSTLGLMWIPIAVFEIVFGFWLLFKVPSPAGARER